jgi:hypothetical protein
MYIKCARGEEVHEKTNKALWYRIKYINQQGCFEAAFVDGTNIKLLIPEAKISIDEELEAFVSELASNTAFHTERDLKQGRCWYL